MDKNQIITGGIVLAILASLLGFWLGRVVVMPGAKSNVPAGNGQNQAGSSATSTGDDTIAVNDQPAGMKVSLALVVLSKDGWVAIHEDRAGAPGNILGAQRFAAGQSVSGAVDLLRATKEGNIYYAMLHSDDSDHIFEQSNDTPITDKQGNIIMVRFVTTAPSR